ncbi:hypothetical protein BASA81_008114 [Batrachochytrium salamandrivorans]|nr:hypothetical protein BASA81_008114 [Batrachochytrium salamandrivorans]
MSLCLDSLSVSASCMGVGRSFTPPEWAVALNSSKTEGIAIHVVKEGEVVDTLKLDETASTFALFGRCPGLSSASSPHQGKYVTLLHASISRSHAAVVRSSEGTMFVFDLGSSHGTLVNGTRLVPFVATPLSNRSAIRFGQSSRIYLVRIFPKAPTLLGGGEEPANTLQNCMVGYKGEEHEGKPKPAEPKMERRVSFSCMAPQVFLFQEEESGCSAATTPTSESGAEVLASPPEARYRKIAAPPLLLLSPSCSEQDSTSAAAVAPSIKRHRSEVL